MDWTVPVPTTIIYKLMELLQDREFKRTGGRYRTRTCDLFHVKETRYQLRQATNSSLYRICSFLSQAKSIGYFVLLPQLSKFIVGLLRELRTWINPFVVGPLTSLS